MHHRTRPRQGEGRGQNVRRLAAALGALAALAAVMAGGARAQERDAKSVAARGRLPRGYLIAQQVAVYNASRFGAISTAEEADKLFGALEGKIDGIEFEPIYYDPHDLRAARVVAESAKRHHIALWMGTFRLRGRVRAFGKITPEFQASVMEPDGRIVPALDENNQPMFDSLNPEAVDWFLERYRTTYIQPFRGLLQGLIFNEDVIPYLAPWKNDRRPDYWRNATYSPRVLALWKEYCRAHDIRHEGKLVERFPVHRPEMVAAGEGQTEYFPGYDVPEKIEPGQAFAELPRAKGAWKAWQEFLAERFAANWIAKVARAFHEANAGNPEWRGTLYFALHQWSLPYEQVRDPQFRVPQTHRWGAWGLQRGLDLERVARLPEIDIVVCETYPPIKANLEGFIAEYARITRAAGKQFGVMLHRDDEWALGERDSEADRWALIRRVQPDVIERYPHQRMLPEDPRHRPDQEAIFMREWQAYRATPATEGK